MNKKLAIVGIPLILLAGVAGTLFTVDPQEETINQPTTIISDQEITPQKETPQTNPPRVNPESNPPSPKQTPISTNSTTPFAGNPPTNDVYGDRNNPEPTDPVVVTPIVKPEPVYSYFYKGTFTRIPDTNLGNLVCIKYLIEHTTNTWTWQETKEKGTLVAGSSTVTCLTNPREDAYQEIITI